MRPFLVCVLAFLPAFLLAQTPVAVVTPEAPRIGDKISVTYNQAATGAALRGMTTVSAEVLLVRATGDAVLLEVAMKQKVNTWTGSVRLGDAQARVVLVRFVAGDKKDENDQKGWVLPVTGKDGKPLRDVKRICAGLHRAGSVSDFACARDMAAAKKDLAEELALYPDNAVARTMQWDLLLREQPGIAMKDSLRAEIERVFAAGKGDETTVAALLPWFQRLGMVPRGQGLRDSILKANPKGEAARAIRLNAVYGERDAQARLPLIESYIADFPGDTVNIANVRSYHVVTLTALHLYDKAEAALAAMSAPEPMLLNQVAWSCVQDTVHLELGLSWAKRSVDMLRRPDPATKPPSMSTAAWKKNSALSLNAVLDTYAAILSLLGRHDEAIAAYQEIMRSEEEKDPEVLQRYLRECLLAQKNEKALEAGFAIIRAGTASEAIVAMTRDAWSRVKGSDAGFEEQLKEARTAARAQMREKLLKERGDKAATDFTLPSIDGTQVSLAALRGKVVVVDFWATWCGPCKMSFPTLQKVYEKYRGDDRVVILTLNCWEREQGAEREKLVKKFLADNKYTFTVLYDTSTVEKYGVTGIPTKFIIDRQGRIAFTSIGFDGAEKMWDELTAEIDLLLAE